MEVRRGIDAFAKAAALVIGGLGLVGAAFAIQEPPAWVFFTMIAAGVPFAVFGGLWLTAMPLPKIRRWWLYHFPGLKNHGTGPLVLEVKWDRVFREQYDEATKEGVVVIEGLRIRNKRREPLTLNTKLIFYPGQGLHAGSWHVDGPEQIEIGKRGRITIPRLSCRTNPATKESYLGGVAKLVLSTPGYGREKHIRLLEDATGVDAVSPTITSVEIPSIPSDAILPGITRKRDLEATIEQVHEPTGRQFCLAVANNTPVPLELSARVSFLYGSERELTQSWDGPYYLPLKESVGRATTVDPQMTGRFRFYYQWEGQLLLYYLIGPFQENLAQMNTTISPTSKSELRCQVDLRGMTITGGDRSMAVTLAKRYRISWSSIEEES